LSYGAVALYSSMILEFRQTQSCAPKLKLSS